MTASSPSRGHSAHIGQTAVVHYRWHPLFGQSVRRFYSERRASGELVHIEVEPGIVVAVPSWMLDPVICAGMGIGEPRVNLAALFELQNLLTSQNSTRSSRDDDRIAKEDRNGTEEGNCPSWATGAGSGAFAAAREVIALLAQLLLEARGLAQWESNDERI